MISSVVFSQRETTKVGFIERLEEKVQFKEDTWNELGLQSLR